MKVIRLIIKVILCQVSLYVRRFTLAKIRLISVLPYAALVLFEVECRCPARREVASMRLRDALA
jgi:hypothetical protein